MINVVFDLNRAVGNAIDVARSWAADALVSIRLEDGLALVFVAFLAICINIELRFPVIRTGLKAIKRSYLTNISTYLFNDISLSILSVPSLYWVARSFSGHGFLSGLPTGPVQWLIAFLLLDLTLYAWHYATHHVDSLWMFHKVHHSDRTFNVTTGLRFHMGELVLEVLVRVAFIIVTGLDAELVLINQAVISLFVLLHHTNVSLPYETLLARVFIVPRLHRRHHSVERIEHDSNYGAVLSIWDHLFGTLKVGEPIAIGLKDVDEQRFSDLIRYGFSTRLEFRRASGLVTRVEESKA